MAQRITQLASHLDPRTWSGKGLAHAQLKGDDDVVIVAAGRTPFCKARKGSLKDTPFDVLCLEMFRGLLAQSGIDPKLLDDVVVGNVANTASAYHVRAAALAAGIPAETPAITVNRWCSSGLMAIRAIANGIQAGEINCGLAVGAEAMSQHDREQLSFSPELTNASVEAGDCRMPMGWTSENVAGDFSISRQQMDEFAARSHQRAAAAQAAGVFDREIIPLTGIAKEGEARVHKTVSADDGIRGSSTAESLAKIKPAFPQWAPANTTGGNASQITDGAAGVILMRRSMARKLNVRILGKYVSCAVSGLAPRIMGIGPTYAIPKLLEQTGISKDQVDLFEINEAFASMGVYCEQKLEIPADKFNVNGGACALGHPLGATGARLVVTILNELERRNQHVGVVSMCIGLGMGAAAVIIRE
ncbi:thiolase, partial [Tilletiopsis washingtonensis]